jgi:hypothetical protein
MLFILLSLHTSGVEKGKNKGYFLPWLLLILYSYINLRFLILRSLAQYKITHEMYPFQFDLLTQFLSPIFAKSDWLFTMPGQNFEYNSLLYSNFRPCPASKQGLKMALPTSYEGCSRCFFVQAPKFPRKSSTLLPLSLCRFHLYSSELKPELSPHIQNSTIWLRKGSPLS